MIHLINLLRKKNISGVYRLSQLGITNVADLSLESSTFGIDQTSKIQTILDNAINNPITVIWDVKCAITQIKVRSNTTINVSKSCGAIQITNSNRQMVINYNKRTTPNDTGIYNFDKRDSNIVINGGIWNQNGQVNEVKKQEHDTDNWQGGNQIFRFEGVDGITLKNVNLVNSRMWNVCINNCDNILVENIVFTLPNQLVNSANYDGIKIGGPANHVRIYNLSGKTHDDMFSICPNDGYFPTSDRKDTEAHPYVGLENGVPTTYSLFDPAATYGDIDDVVVNNVTWAVGSAYGCRLLSSTSKISNILIDGLHGTIKYHAININDGAAGAGTDAWFEAPSIDPRRGFIDNLTIKNFDAEVIKSSYWGYLYVIGFQGNFKNLRLENFTRTDTSIERPFIAFVQNSTFDTIYLKDINVNPLDNIATSIIHYDAFLCNDLILDSVNYNNLFSPNNSSVLLLGYNYNMANILIKNSFSKGCTRYLTGGGIVKELNFVAENIDFSNSNNGIVFNNLSEIRGPTSTIITNVTKDAGSTLLGGYWGGQIINE